MGTEQTIGKMRALLFAMWFGGFCMGLAAGIYFFGSDAMSKIEWTGKTWNPTSGCKKVSPGCANCYAEGMTGRLELMGQADYAGLTKLASDGKRRLFTGEVREKPHRLDVPLLVKKPTTWFVNSMSDLFHEGVTDEFIDRVLVRMILGFPHTYQALTKRAERMASYFAHGNLLYERILEAAEEVRRAFPRTFQIGISNPSTTLPPWVHLGVSVEDRKHGLPRIEQLRKVPAAVRFLSIEPLLEELGPIDLAGIHWVIVGGESGHNARPMHPGWARSIRDQCIAAGVPFFFKQWGQHAPDENGKLWRHSAKHNAGRILDGQTWDEMPKGQANGS